jgi:hypothetical protein
MILGKGTYKSGGLGDSVSLGVDSQHGCCRAVSRQMRCDLSNVDGSRNSAVRDSGGSGGGGKGQDRGGNGELHFDRLRLVVVVVLERKAS